MTEETTMKLGLGAVAAAIILLVTLVMLLDRASEETENKVELDVIASTNTTM